jgi:RecB family exonuclease
VLERWPHERWGEPVSGAELGPLLVAEGAPAEASATRDVAEHLASFLAGPYAAKVRGAATIYREEPFVIEIKHAEGSLSLRGTIDLLIAFPDGSAEIIDYKSSWQPDLADHRFQLRSYAVAARRRFGLSPVRAGIVDLSGGPMPVALEELDNAALDAFEAHLTGLRGQFLRSRGSDEFAPVARPTCESLRCGFLRTCHDGRHGA